MQYWSDILHTAMLGTGKKEPGSETLPPPLKEAVAQLQPAATDKESLFLKTAALAANFRQCSISAIPGTAISLKPAAEESRSYCNVTSLQLLSEILDADSTSLLHLWLAACLEKAQIVHPDIVPRLLDTAIRYKDYRTAIATCCGNRGQWLSQFNEAWNFGSTATPEEIWQTGTLQQRLQVLAQLRQAEPATALAWLQQAWPQEDAATKQELMAVLENKISADDLPFLESLSTEKSKKVKDSAMGLLKLIPESIVVQAYWKVLAEAITLKKEKTMLGLGSKTSLVIALPAQIEETVYKSGIDKLSSNAKQISDELYVLQQLVAAVPPHVWETHLSETKENILALFLKNDAGKLLVPALLKAAIRFKNIGWIRAIAATNKLYDAAALSLLPETESHPYAVQLISAGADQYEVIQQLLSRPETTEWSMALTQQIFRYMATDSWRFGRDFFNHYIHVLPVAFASQLENYTPTADYQRSSWNGVQQHIKKLLQLKERISSSFNA